MIEKEWNKFQEQAVPEDTHKEAVDLCKACFYAGATSLLMSLSKSEPAPETVEKLFLECTEFAKEFPQFPLSVH